MGGGLKGSQQTCRERKWGRLHHLAGPLQVTCPGSSNTATVGDDAGTSEGLPPPAPIPAGGQTLGQRNAPRPRAAGADKGGVGVGGLGAEQTGHWRPGAGDSWKASEPGARSPRGFEGALHEELRAV